MRSYPIYILKLGDDWRIVFPENKANIGHPTFWHQTVAAIVANHFRIPIIDILNMPYCQRRARIVENHVFYGEKTTKDLLRLIEMVTGESGLMFVADDMEKRSEDDVKAFETLVPSERTRSTFLSRLFGLD